MKSIRRTVVAAAALLAMPMSALAADIAVNPVYKAPAYVAPGWSWTGFYAGINAGGGWGRRTGDLVASDPIFAPFIATGDVVTNLGLRPRGWLAGGQVGYNWQKE